MKSNGLQPTIVSRTLQHPFAIVLDEHSINSASVLVIDAFESETEYSELGKRNCVRNASFLAGHDLPLQRFIYCDHHTWTKMET